MVAGAIAVIASFLLVLPRTVIATETTPTEDAKRLKDLQRENVTLKRLLADAELEKAALKEIAEGNFSARDADGPLCTT